MTFFAVRITKHSGLDGDYRMLLRGSSLYAILSRHRGHRDGQHRQNRHVVPHLRHHGAALRLENERRLACDFTFTHREGNDGFGSDIG